MLIYISFLLGERDGLFQEQVWPPFTKKMLAPRYMYIGWKLHGGFLKVTYTYSHSSGLLLLSPLFCSWVGVDDVKRIKTDRQQVKHLIEVSAFRIKNMDDGWGMQCIINCSLLKKRCKKSISIYFEMH